jgi:hypothetical protein
MWGGFRPYGAKSMRAKDMPNVLRPNILLTSKRVTFDPGGFTVLLGVFSPWKKKSLAMTSFGSLQNFPFTNTAQRKVCYCHARHWFITFDAEIKQPQLSNPSYHIYIDM